MKIITILNKKLIKIVMLVVCIIKTIQIKETQIPILPQ